MSMWKIGPACCCPGLAVGLLLALPLTAGAGPSAVAEKLGVRTIPIVDDAPAAVNQPAFDATGALRWDDTPLTDAAPDGCQPTAPVEVRLAVPRVALWRCRVPAQILTGTRADGTPWTRLLQHVSGPHRIGLHLTGASPDALTLDTLEVIDPATGLTLVPPPLRSVDNPPRPMPVHVFHGAATCPRDRGPCYAFNADGAAAGLVRVDRATGRATVLEKPRQRLLAPIVVSDIQFGPDGRVLLLAETWLYRGLKWVRFAVFDLAGSTRVFEERHGEGRVVSSARIVPGPDRQAAFAYRDDSGRRHVVVTYRIRK